MHSASKLDRIGQIAITVTQLDRAVSFYRDTLGLEYLFETPNLAFFKCGSVRLMLSLPEKSANPEDRMVIYFQVDELHSAFEELKARGVDFEDEPHVVAKMSDHDLWMAFFRDTEQNLLGLMCEEREN